MIVLAMEIVGTIAFSVSGAMIGIRKQMDLFGVCVLGVITAVGGGMLRDVLLGKVPGALLNPVYLTMAAVSSLLIFLVLRLWDFSGKKTFLQIYNKLLFLMDAIGLGVFTVVGATVGIESGYAGNRFLLVVLGTITGVGGGLIRDILAGELPYILYKHIYACAAICGGIVYVYTYPWLGQGTALIFSSLLVVVIRILAAYFRWNLPRSKMK